ncbi:MAG: hypothetical protein IPJ30_15120 [Acidobacteria bacterium]|nr:hypothetical protein [Acidobacteriota bacterium]
MVIFSIIAATACRQLVRALAVPDETGNQSLVKPQIDAVCLTGSRPEFSGSGRFPARREDRTLAEVFAERSISNPQIGETDKYAHITYFLNGGVENALTGEQRLMIAVAQRSAVETSPEARLF